MQGDTKLYAVTYTDPSEPWGSAIEGGRLYRTPTQALDALNELFDAYVLGYLTRLRAEDGVALKGNGPNMSALEYIADDFSREYGVGVYHVGP